jgi:hypothetical protein
MGSEGYSRQQGSGGGESQGWRRVGDENKLPGEVTTIDPATLNAAAPAGITHTVVQTPEGFRVKFSDGTVLGRVFATQAEAEAGVEQWNKTAATPSVAAPAGSDLSNLGTNMVAGMTANLYGGLYDALVAGSTRFAGLEDPILTRARPWFDAGLIKSPEDLRALVNSPEYKAGATGPAPAVAADTTAAAPAATAARPKTPEEFLALQTNLRRGPSRRFDPQERQALELVRGAQSSIDPSDLEEGENKTRATLDFAADESGIARSTLHDRVQKALAKIEENITKVNEKHGTKLDTDTAHNLGMQSTLDVYDEPAHWCLRRWATRWCDIGQRRLRRNGDTGVRAYDSSARR